MERRIRVSGDIDAHEFCSANNFKFIKIYEGRGNNNGNWMLLYDDMDNNTYKIEDKSELKSKKNYVIKRTDGLYVGEVGCVYKESDAKRFTKDEANKKSKGMSKSSRNIWNVCIVR